MLCSATGGRGQLAFGRPRLHPGVKPQAAASLTRSVAIRVHALKGGRSSGGRGDGGTASQRQEQKQQQGRKQGQKRQKPQYAVVSYQDDPDRADAALDCIAASFQQGMRDDPAMRFLGGPDCPADFVRSALSRHMRGRRRERQIVCTRPPGAAALVSMYPFPENTGESWWSSLLALRARKEGGFRRFRPSFYEPSPSQGLHDIWDTYRQACRGRFLHISALGVSPELQGRGLGSGLLAWVCGRADAAGLHCVAEAGSERAKRMLQQEGFRVVQSWSAHPDMSYVYVMARPPCPATLGSSWLQPVLTGVGFASGAASTFLAIKSLLASMPPVARDTFIDTGSPGILLLLTCSVVFMASSYGAESAVGAVKADTGDSSLDAYPWAWSEPRSFLSSCNVRAFTTTLGFNVFVAILPWLLRPEEALVAVGASALATATLLTAVAVITRTIWRIQARAGRGEEDADDEGWQQQAAVRVDGDSGNHEPLLQGESAGASGVTVRRQAGWLRLSRMAGARRRLARQGGRWRRMGGQGGGGEVESYGVWYAEDPKEHCA